MIGGLLVSTGVGAVLAIASLIGGHGFWWSLVNYSAGGALTFLIFAAAMLRVSQRNTATPVAPHPDFSNAVYQVAPVPFERMAK